MENIEEYKLEDGTQMYRATFGSTTRYSDDRCTVVSWLEDQILNAEYYEQQRKISEELKEKVLDNWKFYD
jgi:hypothetical protein